MATPAHANALYVLRLVLGSAAAGATAPAARAASLGRRHFSSAVLAHRAALSPSGSSTAAASATASATAAPEADFLELDDSEYVSASSFLPSRPAAPGAGSAPIPWPTVFDHSGTVPPPATPRPCDLVARLVAEERLDAARKVYDELMALHTRIQPRKLYLDAATAALAPTPDGRAAFLFWLGLYPNRAAMNNNPQMKTTWNPIVNRLLVEHLGDTQFIADFLALAGKLGLLPAVLPLLLTPLTTVTPPHESERALEVAITAYRAATTSSTSTSRRAKMEAELVDKQIASWWNRYLRCLALEGWNESARALLYSPPEGVSWTRITRTVVLGQGLERREAAVARQQAREAAEHDNPLLGIRPAAPERPLRRRILAAAQRDRLPPVIELAAIQAQLLERGKLSLLARFRRRLMRTSATGQGTHVKSRTLPTVAALWWWHAEIMRLVAEDRHDEALARFRQHFLWIGLPPLSASASASAQPATPDREGADYTAPRLIPTIQVLTTVIPAVLAAEPDPADYYARYLSHLRRLPPSFKPTDYTHLAFIRTLADLRGPALATDALAHAVAAGYSPGAPSWNALLVALQSRGDVDTALRLLSAMETGAPVSAGAGTVDTQSTGANASAIAMPAPTPRTYLGLIHTAAKSGHMQQAQMYLKRFQRFIGLSAARGRRVSGEDRQLLGVAREAVREGRQARKRAVEAAAAGSGTVREGVPVVEERAEAKVAATGA